MTLLEVSAAQIDKVVKSISNTTPGNIPVKDTTGGVEDSSVSQDTNGQIRAIEKVLLEKGSQSPGGTYRLGDNLSIKGLGAAQVNVSEATGFLYHVLYQRVDKSGSEEPIAFGVAAEALAERQLIYDTPLVSGVPFSLPAAGVYEFINAIKLKTDGPITNLRYRVKSLVSGNIVDSFPDTFSFEKGVGKNFPIPGDIDIDLYFPDDSDSTPNSYPADHGIEITMRWEGVGNILGNSSGLPFYSYAAQEFKFLQILTREFADNRIKAHLSTDLPILYGVDTVIPFDVTDLSKGISLSGGEFTVNDDGYYAGNIIPYIYQSGNPNLIIWIECKPFSTGVWELCTATLLKLYAVSDTGTSFPMDGDLELRSGDKLRIMARLVNNGFTVGFKSITEAVGLGTLTQHSVSVSIRRVSGIVPT